MGTRCESHRKEGLLSTPTNQKKNVVDLDLQCRVSPNYGTEDMILIYA